MNIFSKNWYLDLYSPVDLGENLAYMLQNVEYSLKDYYSWLFRRRFIITNQVQYRRKLERTKVAKIIAYSSAALLLFFFALGAFVAITSDRYSGVVFILISPILVGLFAPLPILPARAMQNLMQSGRNKETSKMLNQFKQKSELEIKNIKKPIVVAIAGSYGKSSMKEVLSSLISSDLEVAFTPGNKNVPYSHWVFTKKLTGKEDVIIYELGEGQPGDIVRFTNYLKPDYAIITGLAPAHLDRYKTLSKVRDDFRYLCDFVGENNCFINGDSKDLNNSGLVGTRYSEVGIGDIKINKDSLKIDLMKGMSFKLKYQDKSFDINTKLIGEHLISTIVMAVYFTVDLLNLKIEDVTSQIINLKAFEHRLELKKVATDSHIIDDTYNGNIEGIKVGLALLEKLKVSGKKLYVTPGLVGQGVDTYKIHQQIGQLIKNANPDKVFLIANSASPSMEIGLKGYKGEVEIVDDPLKFYTNLENILAKGDIILMQNDWPDNYW
jgi:UDP-N-acetylmuramoyl-tripeptide--D-alanyl-D-alanine ligase